jgi:hypothetical protein
MTTIMVDPDDGGVMTGTMLPPPPGWKPTPIRDRPDEPIDPEADCVVYAGDPCLLFGMLDYAENWGGEFVRELHPFTLIGAPKIGEADWWALVRTKQAARAYTPGNG